MGYLDKLKQMILPVPSSKDGGRSKKNKNSMVVEELVYAFRDSIERTSFGNVLMCHTAYVVYVPQSYYNELHLMFGIMAQEVADMLQNELKERLGKNRNLKFKSVSDFWSFDLISLGEGAQDTPDEEDPDSTVTYEDLEERFVAVRSGVAPKDIYDFSGCSDDEVVKTNQSQPNSTFNRMQCLNVSAIRGLKPSGTGYSYPISLTGGSVVDTGAKEESGRVLATLKSADFDVRFIDAQGKSYEMINVSVPDFYIGGASASANYQGKPMIRLDSEAVQSPHLQIARRENGDFFIRAIGHVEQGGIEMKKNEWVRLSNRHASIMINGETELIFNKK